MENEDVERVVARIDEEALQTAFVTVEPEADVVGHQESEQGRDGQREELLEGRTPVHVGRQVFREEQHDDGEENGRQDGRQMIGDELTVLVGILSEDEPTAEEETTHQVAIASLNEGNDLQAFVGLPPTEQQHDNTNDIGRSVLCPLGQQLQHYLIYNKV